MLGEAPLVIAVSGRLAVGWPGTSSCARRRPSVGSSAKESFQWVLHSAILQYLGFFWSFRSIFSSSFSFQISGTLLFNHSDNIVFRFRIFSRSSFSFYIFLFPFSFHFRDRSVQVDIWTPSTSSLRCPSRKSSQLGEDGLTGFNRFFYIRLTRLD